MDGEYSRPGKGGGGARQGCSLSPVDDLEGGEGWMKTDQDIEVCRCRGDDEENPGRFTDNDE